MDTRIKDALAKKFVQTAWKRDTKEETVRTQRNVCIAKKRIILQ